MRVLGLLVMLAAPCASQEATAEDIKSLEVKLDAQERKDLEQANPDPVKSSVLPLVAGAGALLLPFAGWFALKKTKGD